VGDESIVAKNIIIATGSKATMPAALMAEQDPRVVTSTELLQMATQPKRLCIIGAGVIGMEFASVFQRFGTEVTVIEFLKECLPMVDSDVAKRLRKLLEKRGITFRMKTAVQTLQDIDADVILIATGRQANTEGLNVEAAGITLDERGNIPVDNDYRCVSCDSVATNIYAIGDVNGRQMLAHAAEMQALHVVNHIVGHEDDIRFDIMPAAIFTEPEAACVGLSEDDCKERGMAYHCGKAFWRANGKALAMGQTDGILKLLSDADGQIVGCHAFGAHAADLVQEVSALMCRNTSVEQLRNMVHIHPTLSELLLDAANS
jgi:dihydrolipoamide dehydrogenase